MKIYKITGDIIDTDLLESYQYEDSDRVLLDTVDPGTGLRRVVGYAGYKNNIVFGDKAYSVETNVKCLKEDGTIAANVILTSPTLRVDETTYVNPDTGDYVAPDTEGAITEYEFVRRIIHYAPENLLTTLFGGIKKAEYYNRYNNNGL